MSKINDEMKQKYYEWLIKDTIETNNILNSMPIKYSIVFYRKINNILNSTPSETKVSFFSKIKKLLTFK